MLSVYPSSFIIRAGTNFNVLFIIDCPDCAFTKKYIHNEAGFKKYFTNFIQNNVYLLRNSSLSNTNNNFDTIPVIMDSNFIFLDRKSYVKDL